MVFKADSDDFDDSTPGNDVDLLVPSSALKGDYMVVVIMTTDNRPEILVTAPSTEPWRLFQGPIDIPFFVGSPPGCWLFRKVVSQDDEDNAGTKTYIWSFDGAEEQIGWLGLYDPVTFGEYALNAQSGKSTVADAPSVTTTTPHEIVLFCGWKDAGVAFVSTPNGSAIERVHARAGGDDTTTSARLGIVEQTYDVPVATGDKGFTHEFIESSGFTFSLIPLGTEWSPGVGT